MTLADEAQQQLRQGNAIEAERLYERVLSQSPDHIEALNVVALAALRNGQLSRALTLLERAAACDPMHAVTQHHLGTVHSAVGDFAAAVTAQSQAVALQTNFYVARLYLARALESLGEGERAAVQYLRALQDAQQVGRWLNAESTPQRLQPMIEHAIVMVRDRSRIIFNRLLESLASKFGQESISRVVHALRVYLKEIPTIYPDVRQRPTMFFFPGLAPAAYLDQSLFAWRDDLQAATQSIRSELESLLPNDAGRERVFNSEALEQRNLRGVNSQPSWDGYYFYRYGERRAANHEQCSETSRALQRLPLCHVPLNAPEVLFSVFAPGTHLLPHRGVTNTRLVGHLPLIIPADCALNVGGELHRWQEGKVVVFDDTYEHEAWNRSDAVRVVLIFDIWNPHLTEAERTAVTDIITFLNETSVAVAAA